MLLLGRKRQTTNHKAQSSKLPHWMLPAPLKASNRVLFSFSLLRNRYVYLRDSNGDKQPSAPKGNSMLNLQHGLSNVMDFHKMLYANSPCKSELNKKKITVLLCLVLELCYFKEFTWENTDLLYTWLIFYYFAWFLIDFDETNLHLVVLDHNEFIFCA